MIKHHYISMLAFPLMLHAQPPTIDCYNLSYTQELPPLLLEERSVGITMPHTCTQENTSWKDMAQSAHQALKKVGIDLVAHFDIHDLYANTYAREAFARQLRIRNIHYLVFFLPLCTPVQHQDSIQLIITPFNKESSFLNHKQQAWQCIDESINACAKRIDQYIIENRLTIKNFLIHEQVETFLIDLIPKNRSTVLPSDLKQTWLAILSEDSTSSSLYKTCLENTTQQQQQIDSLMSVHYETKYTFISPQENLQTLFRKGYEYLLIFIYASESSIQTMLEYPHIQKTTEHKAVYKFYIRHLLSQRTYVGHTWDAHPALEQALKTFLQE